MSEKPIYELSRTIETRWASPENYGAERGAGGKTSFGRKGSPCRGRIKAGETWVLAEGQGTGTIRRMWFTLADRGYRMLRGLVIRMYWDGAGKPAVEAPLGDFFGNPLGRQFVFANAYFNNPEGRNWNCTLPMPFRKGFKITIANESPMDNDMLWYHIDYTLGDAHGDDVGYLHAYWNRENPTTLRRDFRIMPEVRGRGRYLGCTLGLITRPYYASWWGEGEVKIYLDGDTQHPTLCGTGTEDYACSAWGIGSFNLPWYGCQMLKTADADRQQVAMYRLHGPDPVYFQQSCRVDLQQIGYWGGEGSLRQLERTGQKGVTPAGDGKTFLTLEQLRNGAPVALHEREDDWCATAYFYLDQAATDLPAIAPYDRRVADLTGEPTDLDCVSAQLAKLLARLPGLEDLPARLLSRNPQEALRDANELASHQAGVASLVEQAQRLVKSAPQETARSVAEQLARVKTAGLSRPAYATQLRTCIDRWSRDLRLPVTLRHFEASALLPPAPDIAKAKLPARGLRMAAVPFVPATELADIRQIHKDRDGLVYLRSVVTVSAAGKGQILYGADGPVRIWLNGKAIGCHPEATNPAVIGQYTADAAWKKGRNTVIWALNTNHGKAWGIVARMTRTSR